MKDKTCLMIRLDGSTFLKRIAGFPKAVTSILHGARKSYKYIETYKEKQTSCELRIYVEFEVEK